MRHKKNILPALLLSFMAIILFGCSGGGDSGSASATSDGGSGSLSLQLTDATTLDYSAVYVTIDRVDVHMGENYSNGGADTWKTVAAPAATYNLLELVNGVMRQLGVSQLSAGRYTQMRLIIGTTPYNDSEQSHPYANYLILADTGAVHELKIPSGPQTGIKLVRAFDIEANQLTELVLDFDASRSIVKAGRSGLWLLKPTIKVLDTIEMGIIEGMVVDDNEDGIGKALVSAQISDLTALSPSQEVLIEAASPTDNGEISDDGESSKGEFAILVQPGTYNVVAGKPGYSHSVQCSVNVAAGEAVFLENYFSINELTSNGDNAYGTLRVNIDLQSDEAHAAISIRTAACGGMVEVASDRIIGSGESEFLLPPGAYQIVAWHPDGQLQIYSGTVDLDAGAVTSVPIDQ